MRRWLVLVAVCACSGDDSHRHALRPPVAPTPEAKPDAAMPLPPGTAALAETMAVSYWQAGDAQTGAARFAAKDFAAAKTAFEAARAVEKDGNRTVRLELLLRV